jgi:hypothetical protein
MRDTDYLHLTDEVPFNIPENRGHQPVIPDGVAAHIREQLMDWHNRDQAQFVAYRAVESSLKCLLCKATNPDWFTALNVSTRQVPCKEMITHLWTRFGRIEERDMHEYREQPTVLWDPAQPINILFAQLNHCRTTAVAGGKPMGNVFLTHSAFTLLLFSWKTPAFSLKHAVFGA